MAGEMGWDCALAGSRPGTPQDYLVALLTQLAFLASLMAPQWLPTCGNIAGALGHNICNRGSGSPCTSFLLPTNKQVKASLLSRQASYAFVE